MRTIAPVNISLPINFQKVVPYSEQWFDPDGTVHDDADNDVIALGVVLVPRILIRPDYGFSQVGDVAFHMVVQWRPAEVGIAWDDLKNYTHAGNSESALSRNSGESSTASNSYMIAETTRRLIMDARWLGLCG
jgi:hypothetical protein